MAFSKIVVFALFVAVAVALPQEDSFKDSRKAINEGFGGPGALGLNAGYGGGYNGAYPGYNRPGYGGYNGYNNQFGYNNGFGYPQNPYNNGRFGNNYPSGLAQGPPF